MKVFRLAKKVVVLGALLSLCLYLVNLVLKPKFFIDDMWPTTATYQGFYRMEKDTVDVLFLGSSHASAALIPQEMYDKYGILSYNIACEQQSLVSSYYWLKEALKYQKPKAVVFDCYMVFNAPLSNQEACLRKAVDAMKWSKNKCDYIRDICEIDQEQTLSSYVFTNLRFHDRWQNLTENDFKYFEMSKHYELKGYSVLMDKSPSQIIEPFSKNDSKDMDQINEVTKQYMEKIILLCKENQIALILMDTPSNFHGINNYNAVKNMADEHHLLYYDFCEADLWRAICFDYQNDMNEDAHVNLAGAIKISDYLGNELMDRFHVGNKKNSQWDETREYFGKTKELFYYDDVTALTEYAKMFHNERYSVFFAVRNWDRFATQSEFANVMQILDIPFLEGDFHNQSFLAVIEGEKVINQKYEQGENICKGTIRNGVVPYSINVTENVFEIKVNDQIYSCDADGIFVVVYDNYLKKIVRKACFDYDYQLTSLRMQKKIT